MDAIKCLKTRRSVRVFLDRPVSRDIIEDIVDCGRLAATASNEQPWLFIAIDDATVRRRIAELTDHGKFLADVPACIAVFCRDVKYFLEDGSAASMNMLNAATAHNLGSCWVAGDKKPYAPAIAALLGVSDPYRLVSLIAVGYPAEQPPADKRRLSDMLSWNRY